MSYWPDRPEYVVFGIVLFQRVGGRLVHTIILVVSEIIDESVASVNCMLHCAESLGSVSKTHLSLMPASSFV